MSEFKGTPGSWSIDQTGDIVSGPYNVCIPYATKAEDKVLMAASKDLFEALLPFASLLDALELQSNGPKKGVWYSCESSVVGIREISMEDFAAARAAIAKALGR